MAYFLLTGIMVIVVVLCELAITSAQNPIYLPPTPGAVKRFYRRIKGVTYDYQGTNREPIIHHCRLGEDLKLVPEPSNRFDPYAVRICRQNGEIVGYWPASRSAAMSKMLVDGVLYRVRICRVGTVTRRLRVHGVRLFIEQMTPKVRRHNTLHRTVNSPPASSPS